MQFQFGLKNMGLSDQGSYPIYTCAMSAPVVWLAGLATASYGGLALSNPVATGTQSAVKLVPLKASFVPTGVGTAGNFLALAKIYGTNSALGTAAGSAGPVFQAGVSGTTTSARGIAYGTFTMSNGTATSAYVEFLAGGGATAGSPNAAQTSLDGELTVMPGELLVFSQGIAGTGIASITWMEVPL